jgi:hypothetical protein
MRLSTAMMLGGTVHTLNAACWDRCLLGVSIKAVGGADNWYNREAVERWPWITGVCQPPVHLLDCYTFYSCPTVVTTIISQLAVYVEDGAITLEQAVDWVRQIEPSDDGCADDCADTCAEMSNETLTSTCTMEVRS